MSELSRSLERISDRFSAVSKQYLFPWVAAAIMIALVRWSLEASMQRHWLLGLVTAILVALFAEGARRKAGERAIAHESGTVMSVRFVLMVYMAIAAAALFTYLGVQQEWFRYASSSPFGLGLFLDYYAWTFLDLVPALEIPATLGWQIPMELRGGVSGLLVLSFKGWIVWGVIALYGKWQKKRKKRTSAAAANHVIAADGGLSVG